MSEVINIDPVVGQPHIELDLVQHFVAQILASTGPDVANFTNGCVDVKSANPAQIALYPYYYEDKPDNAGVVRVVDRESNGEVPIRWADCQVSFRMPKTGTGAATLAAQKRAMAAAEALRVWMRPNGVVRTETDSTLPSGRLVRLWNNSKVTPEGEDGSDRFIATVTFEIMYLDINVP